MTNKTEKMNVFLANLAIMNIKVHNLHWNIVGSQFITIHKLTEKIYKKLQEQFDEVAEAIKMQNKLPLATMSDYLEYSTVEEVESRDYTGYEVLDILSESCSEIIDLAKEIRTIADDEDNFLTANMMEDYIACYTKFIWMIRSMQQDDTFELDEEDDNE